MAVPRKVNIKNRKRLEYNQNHSLNRLRERYSSNFSKEDLIHINSIIKKGNYIRGIQVNEYLYVYEVKLKQRFVYAFYNKARQVIITFLPETDPRIQFYFKHNNFRISDKVNIDTNEMLEYYLYTNGDTIK
jgi:hypothetical protein